MELREFIVRLCDIGNRLSTLDSSLRCDDSARVAACLGKGELGMLQGYIVSLRRRLREIQGAGPRSRN